jgi:exonuclease III
MSMLSFNIEGYKRNRHYLATLIQQQNPAIIFLQELWLPYEDQILLEQDFPDYNFLLASPDMFEHSEDKILSGGMVWQGAAIAWHDTLSSTSPVIPLPVTCDRFVAVLLSLEDNQETLAISLYAPTSGRDDDFLECLDFLSNFIQSHMPVSGSVIIGTDSNCSMKSSKRRKEAWSGLCKEFSLQILSLFKLQNCWSWSDLYPGSSF